MNIHNLIKASRGIIFDDPEISVSEMFSKIKKASESEKFNNLIFVKIEGLEKNFYTNFFKVISVFNKKSNIEENSNERQFAIFFILRDWRIKKFTHYLDEDYGVFKSNFSKNWCYQICCHNYQEPSILERRQIFYVGGRGYDILGANFESPNTYI